MARLQFWIIYEEVIPIW